MDILSHGLWAALSARAVNKKLAARDKLPRRLDVNLAFLWGILPDLIPFTPIFILVFYGLLHGQMFPFRPAQTGSLEGLGTPVPFILELTKQIYSFTHSFIIFFICFFMGWAFRRFVTPRGRGLAALPFEMGGWFLHILVDIPTHAADFYPTPFIWPLSNYHVSGVPWASPVVYIPNLIGLAVFYWWIKRRPRTS
ncbi:MAG TPA: metal-dependent hydrolase [Candidatus Paceibacterota bacterium]|nr:metal-dependent hydrolase [Candidatus Paceibacterota bacterium]